jgi:hypothetical protein
VDDLQTEAVRTIKSARLGDQNALDVVRLVGVNAGKGDAKALAAKKAMSDWILANPVAGARVDFSMGAEATRGCGALMRCGAWEVPALLCELTESGPLGIGNGDKDGSERELAVGILILSRRAALSTDLIREMAMGLEEEPRRLFWWGVAMCTDSGPSSAFLSRQPPSVKGPALAGKAVGTARKIQRVISGAPISVLDRQAGLEHGEP